MRVLHTLNIQQKLDTTKKHVTEVVTCVVDTFI